MKKNSKVYWKGEKNTFYIREIQTEAKHWCSASAMHWKMLIIMLKMKKKTRTFFSFVFTAMDANGVYYPLPIISLSDSFEFVMHFYVLSILCLLAGRLLFVFVAPSHAISSDLCKLQIKAKRTKTPPPINQKEKRADGKTHVQNIYGNGKATK